MSYGEYSQPEYHWCEPAPSDDGLDDEYVERQRANSLIDCARRLDEAQREIHEQHLWSAQLYSNRELAAFDWGTGQLARASMSPISHTGENLANRVVETHVSQVGKNRPKPKPVPRGASFRVRNQVRLLDKFLYGEFQRNWVYPQGKRIYRDACIFGFGCMHVSVEDEGYEARESDGAGARVCYKRVFPDEMLVDQLEVVACGKMRHLYRRRVLPIEVVAATYGLEVEELRECSTDVGFTYLDYRPIGAGWIVVVEGYQANGRWMCATHNKVLDEGTWDHDWFPYVFFSVNDPISGFYAPGLVEQVLPYQIRLNEINEVIRDAQDLMARPRIFVAEGTRVNPYEIDNVVGRIIKYTGIKPEPATWPAVSAELYGERDRLVRTCLDQFGLSELATNVSAPSGARFDSSKAFREFNSIQDDRLSDPAQRYEDFYRELAMRTIDVVECSGKNVTTTWYSGYRRNKAEVISWEDIEHAASSYIMSMEMTSLYSMSPAAATDELEKQLAMGLITPEQYRLELAELDQESSLSLMAAAAEDIERVIDLLESGQFETPTQDQDLVNGVQRVTFARLALKKYEDVPARIHLNFINWVTLARAILRRGTEPEPTVPAAGGMVAPGPMGMNPAAIPVPESAGLAVAAPGPMPNV